VPSRLCSRIADTPPKTKPKCKITYGFFYKTVLAERKIQNQEGGHHLSNQTQSKTKNLTRNKAITLRMTQEELDFFQKQLGTAKPKNQTDFFLAVLRKKPIIVIEDLRPMLLELKRHGNNLNQITRKLNENNSFGESAIKVMNECWKA
jgi:hypothetical protein